MSDDVKDTTEDNASAPVKVLNVQIDRTKITFGDVRFMGKLQNKTGDAEANERMFDFLDRIVIGGIDHLPFDSLPQLMEAVSAALSQELEIKN